MKQLKIIKWNIAWLRTSTKRISNISDTILPTQNGHLMFNYDLLPAQNGHPRFLHEYNTNSYTMNISGILPIYYRRFCSLEIVVIRIYFRRILLSMDYPFVFCFVLFIFCFADFCLPFDYLIFFWRVSGAVLSYMYYQTTGGCTTTCCRFLIIIGYYIVIIGEQSCWK